MCVCAEQKYMCVYIYISFLLHTFETKGPLFSYDVCGARGQLKQKVCPQICRTGLSVEY